MEIGDKTQPIDEKAMSLEHKHKSKDYKIYKEEIENYDKNLINQNIEISYCKYFIIVSILIIFSNEIFMPNQRRDYSYSYYQRIDLEAFV